ncbi:MAG: hypothetical protein MK098_08830 [Marinovum sp.]|nr:hypothetical protein [Marinovum sp.]
MVANMRGWGITFALLLATGASAESSAVVSTVGTGSIIPNLIAPSSDSTQISVIVDPGVRGTRDLRSQRLRQARQDVLNGTYVPADLMRALAEAGDGLAAQRYVRLLQAEPGAPASDLAYFSAVAVGSGRVWTLGTMIKAMHALDPTNEPRDRVRKYITVLYPHAWAGNTLALEAVAAFNGEGRLFGALSDRTRQRILDEARTHGGGRLELSLAMTLLERARMGSPTAPSDTAQAKELLELAVASDQIAVHTTAANLLRLIQPTEGGDND